jgi:hypothetical protein
VLLVLPAASLLGAFTEARAAEPATAKIAATSSRPAPSSPASTKRDRRETSDEATRGRPRVAPRMLDDIRIEGEIPVPQVLFVTARDQRRFMEFQHHRYQLTSLELGRATPGPSRLVVTTPSSSIPPSPDKAKQEDPR